MEQKQILAGLGVFIVVVVVVLVAWLAQPVDKTEGIVSVDLRDDIRVNLENTVNVTIHRAAMGYLEDCPVVPWSPEVRFYLYDSNGNTLEDQIEPTILASCGDSDVATFKFLIGTPGQYSIKIQVMMNGKQDTYEREFTVS